MRKAMKFEKWINKFLNEKNFCTEQVFEVEGNSGQNIMNYEMVIAAIKSTCESEQKQIRLTLIKLDFQRGDISHYFRHLAQALAI
jgi:hypothetical protein